MNQLTTVALVAAGLVASSCRKGPPSEIVTPIPRAAATTPVYPIYSGGVPNTIDSGAGSGGTGGGAAFDGSAGGDASAGRDAVAPDVAPPPPFTKTALLEAIAACTVAQFDEFEDRARELVAATGALAGSADSDHLERARTAWRNAMASWERAELFRFGPAAPSMDPGGQNLRDEIYIFPLANSCKVDQQLVDRSYTNPAKFLLPAGALARGLTALEYLLFHTAPSNACSPYITINSNGAWAAITPELPQRRADYAHAAAQDVLARATALTSVWDPSSGAFHGEFVRAGRGSSVYAIDQIALNAVSNALLYVETEVKDWKLAVPLGLVAECLNTPDPCPDRVESRYALASTDDIRQNLVAFRRLFQGCGAANSGLGFDDWLVAVGASGVSDRILDALTGAEASVAALNPPLEAAVLADPARLRAVHTAVKRLTDILKTEFVTVLDLELPSATIGDND
jgi:uncharacterized protein